MADTIAITVRKTIDIDVFLNGTDEIIGYQLGQKTAKEFTVKLPFLSDPPPGTKVTVTISVYGRLEYRLDNHTKQTEVVKYEVDEDSLKTEVEAKLKEAENKGICVAYKPIVPSESDGCTNCSYKTICT